MQIPWISNSNYESKLKGYRFEQFVVRGFEHGAYTLLRWRSDKQAGEIFAAENSEPDLVIRFTGKKKRAHFAVECKYRSKYHEHDTVKFDTDQLRRYEKFGENNRIPVFLILGLQGSPSKPRDLFIIPLKVILATPILSKTDLAQYHKLGSYDSFKFDISTMQVV